MAKKAAIQANRMCPTESSISMSVNTAAGVDKNLGSAWSKLSNFLVVV